MTKPSPPNEDRAPSESDDSTLRGLLGAEVRGGEESLDFAGQKMKNEVKANLLGTPQEVAHIGRFRVISKIGQGAMGAVYEADDERLRRRVAIKLLHRKVGDSDRERRARLQREAQALAQLSHPNLVQVYEVGEHDAQLFMVMELVPGKTLDQVQANTPSSGWRRILELYLMAGKGLAAAHAKNVVHRDFKPHNVIVDETGVARVVDFGLARGVLDDQEPTTEIPVLAKGAIERPQFERITASGDNPGTPRFMAPELFSHRPATPASDQYSFCVALYGAIYGQHPFAGTTWKEILAHATAGRVRLPSVEVQPKRPRWLFDAVSRGLAPKPEERHPSLEALLAELEKERGRAWRLTAIALALVSTVGATWWVRGQSGFDMDAHAAEHEQACRAQGEQMRETWRNIRDGLARPRSADDDVRGIAVEQFIATWEGTCVSDLESRYKGCRALTRQTYDAMLKSDDIGSLSEESFFSLAWELELCAESRPEGICGGPDSGSEVTRELAAAKAAYAHDDLERALDLAEKAGQNAETNRDTISQVRALLVRGAIHETRAELNQARSVLEEGLGHAARCDLDTMFVDLGLERIEVESLHGGREGVVGLLLVLVREMLTRASMRNLLLHRAQFYMKEGGVRLYLEGRCSEAMVAFTRAQAMFDQANAERKALGRPTATAARLAADVRLNIANLQLEAYTNSSPGCERDWPEDKILAAYHDARARFIAVTGSEMDLGLAPFEFSAGAAHQFFGQSTEAIERFRAVLKIYERHLDPNNALIGDAHRGLAASFRDAGDFEAALKHAQINLELRQKGDESGPLPLAEAHDAVGVLKVLLGRPKEAISYHDDAITVLTSTGQTPTNHEAEQLLFSYIHLGDAKWEAGDVEGASDAAREARRRLETTPRRKIPLLNLLEARVCRSQGDYDCALEALSIVDVDGSLDPHNINSIDLRWERVLLDHARKWPLERSCEIETPKLVRALTTLGHEYSRRLRAEIERWRQANC